MPSTAAAPPTDKIATLHLTKTIDIAAPIDIAFRAVLEELGPGSELPDGASMRMRLEPFPGGRWFRDLGNDAGHLWGHVQVIKPPRLLELSGPMFMSYPATNFIQYRLTEEGAHTRLDLTHRAMGLIPEDDGAGVGKGWDHGLNRVREIAERMSKENR